jgi:hypothetical protein
MHTVVLLAHALNLAERLGYAIRQEWIDCNGGGGCEFRGRKYLFIDLATPPGDQLEKVIDVLRREPGAAEHPMPSELRAALRLRKIA